MNKLLNKIKKSGIESPHQIDSDIFNTDEVNIISKIHEFGTLNSEFESLNKRIEELSDGDRAVDVHKLIDHWLEITSKINKIKSDLTEIGINIRDKRLIKLLKPIDSGTGSVMRYLKRFNESIDDDITKIFEHVKDISIELKDMGFRIRFEKFQIFTDVTLHHIHFDKWNNEKLAFNRFSWVDIKDCIIHIINYLEGGTDVIKDVTTGYNDTLAYEFITRCDYRELDDQRKMDKFTIAFRVYR